MNKNGCNLRTVIFENIQEHFQNISRTKTSFSRTKVLFSKIFEP